MYPSLRSHSTSQHAWTILSLRIATLKEPAMTPVSMHETQHLLVAEPAWLMAIGARLWVTRQGELDDHVLAPGERLAVACGDRLVVGPWSPGDGAGWVWQSRGGAAGRALVGYGWRRLPAVCCSFCWSRNSRWARRLPQRWTTMTRTSTTMPLLSGCP